MCIKIFENVRLTWLAAYLFCQQQNGQLISLTMTEGMGFSQQIRIRQCWGDDVRFYAPQDPLEGWQWINGSQYTSGYRWVLRGILDYYKNGKRCAVVHPADGIWRERSCTSSQNFICKKVCEFFKPYMQLKVRLRIHRTRHSLSIVSKKLHALFDIM